MATDGATEGRRRQKGRSRSVRRRWRGCEERGLAPYNRVWGSPLGPAGPARTSTPGESLATGMLPPFPPTLQHPSLRCRQGVYAWWHGVNCIGRTYTIPPSRPFIAKGGGESFPGGRKSHDPSKCLLWEGACFSCRHPQSQLWSAAGNARCVFRKTPKIL